MADICEEVLLLLRLAVDDGVVAAFDSIVMLVGIVGISLAEAEMERQREKNRQERLEAEREAERIREAEENKKKQLEEIATLKKKFGGIPTRVVTYICDFDPKQKEMEQPFLFPISSLDAQARVIETCEHSWFFRQGGGAKIISNIAYR